MTASHNQKKNHPAGALLTLLAVIVLSVFLAPSGAVAETSGRDVPYDPERVSAGGMHSCALKVGGDIDCWGSNSYGQGVDKSGPFTQVSAGWLHTCGLKADGSVTCWGSNSHGQSTDRSGPFVQVSAGGFHNCALKASGVAECWGDIPSGTDPDQEGPFTQISAGMWHTCGVRTNGNVSCWGDNTYGQGGEHTIVPYVQVSAGTYRTCALSPDGSVSCWGNRGESLWHPGPFVQISQGGEDACGLMPDGSVDCWGRSGSFPTVDPPDRFRQISVGHDHQCGLKRFGSLYCWGNNDEGQASAPSGAAYGQIIGAPVAVEDSYNTPIGVPLTVNALGVLANDANALGDPRVYYLDAAGHIHEMLWFSNWWQHVDITGLTFGESVAGALTSTTVNGDPRLYYIAASGHIHEVAWAKGALYNHWVDSDLMKGNDWSAAAKDTPLSAGAIAGSPRLYYLDDNAHIHELALSDGKWSQSDITAAAAATPAKPGGPLAVTVTANGDPAIYYFTPDYEVHEIASYGGRWLYWDLMSATSAPPAAAASPLHAISVNSNPRVYYRTGAGRVIELAFSGSEWRDTDLHTAIGEAGGSLAAGDMAAIASIDGRPRVYYLDSLGQVREFSWNGSEWNNTNLMTKTGAPPASADARLVATTAHLDPRVYYQATSGQVHELAWVVDTWYTSSITERAGGAAAKTNSPLSATTANVDPLAAVKAGNPAHGALQLKDDGSFTYTPAAGYEGPDSFTYKASDWWSLSKPITVHLNVGPPLAIVDVDVDLYNNPLGSDRAPYENIMRYFADALYESSNGARKLGQVNFYASGNNPSDVEIFWLDKCHPSASVAGFGTGWGSISMCDEFWANECKPNEPCKLVFLYDYLLDDEHQRSAGYTIAHEWGHFYFGLYDEYRGRQEYDTYFAFPHSTDTPVNNSIMHNQGKAVGGDFNWLNFSTDQNFNMDTAQGRVYGAPAWSTLSRPASADPRDGDRNSATTRRAYPDLQKVSPQQNAAAPIELPGTARSALSFTWTQSPLAFSRGAAPTVEAALHSILGNTIAYPNPILLHATVGNQLPLTGVGVSGSARLLDGTIEPVTFSDDGRPPDARAADGVYSAIVPYAQDGLYELSVTFDNHAGTAAFVATSFQPAAGPGGEAVPLPPPVPYSVDFTQSALLHVVVSNVKADDHGDAPASATSISANNEPAPGKIDRAGDKDLFRFQALGSGPTYVRITDLALGINPVLRILGPDGTSVLFSATLDPSRSLYLYLPVTGVAPGTTLYAELSDASNSAKGGLYQFSAGSFLASDIPNLKYRIYLPHTRS